MTGVVSPITTKQLYPSHSRCQRKLVLFTSRLGQFSARSLKGFDAFYLLTIDHPHMTKAFPLDCPVI
jgi:hypothetical protein